MAAPFTPFCLRWLNRHPLTQTILSEDKNRTFSQTWRTPFWSSLSWLASSYQALCLSGRNPPFHPRVMGWEVHHHTPHHRLHPDSIILPLLPSHLQRLHPMIYSHLAVPALIRMQRLIWMMRRRLTRIIIIVIMSHTMAYHPHHLLPRGTGSSLSHFPEDHLQYTHRVISLFLDVVWSFISWMFLKKKSAADGPLDDDKTAHKK